MVHSETPGVPPASEINQEIYSRRVDFGGLVVACRRGCIVVSHINEPWGKSNEVN